MLDENLFVLAILAVNIAVCEWLVAKTVLSHIGTALLVIVLTAIEANLGLIPSSTNAPILYDQIFLYVAPLAIFFLLLECNFEAIRHAGIPLLTLFLIGSMGTVVGAIVGGFLVNGPENLGTFYPQIAGMFTGTYTGGSINFNAVALEYEVNKEGNLYAGAVAIDNIWTALWMIVTIGLPKVLNNRFKRVKKSTIKNNTPVSELEHPDSETVNPFGLSILVALGIFAIFISDQLESSAKLASITIPSILILTTISLVLAQFRQIQRIRGSRILGIIGIYLFLAVIGAYCDFSTLPNLGDMAYHLLFYVGLIVVIHGLITFGLGAIFKQDWDLIALASQANVGGSGSALALARSLNREDLLLPAILIGTLGNALGTYLGFLVVSLYL